jgi:uncharacterized phage-like protein YoqJ
MTSYTVTGHRPPKLGGYSNEMQDELEGFAHRWLRRLNPELVYTGMALGWDQAIAYACTRHKVPFIAAIPFLGQEHIWPEKSQETYHDLLSHATEVVHVCKDIDEGIASAMDTRNRWMINRGDRLLALWDGERGGGTYNAVRYAQIKGKPVTNLWWSWKDPAVEALL